MPDQVQGDIIEFTWGVKRGRGGAKKDVQFYESFTYDGVEYFLYDSIYLFKDDENEPYIGKLIKIWEQKNKIRRVKVLWFFRPHEVSNYLGNEEVLENELFLACGDVGRGLANINSLEAIAGKCNVVCISKDERNRQPSDLELMAADHIFYRTFDVEKLIISDKLDEKIAAVEVKYLLNKSDSQNSSLPKFDPVGSQKGPESVARSQKGLVMERTDSGRDKAIKYDDDDFSALVKGEKENQFTEPHQNAALVKGEKENQFTEPHQNATNPVVVAVSTAESHRNFEPKNISRSISLKQSEVADLDKCAKDVGKLNAKVPQKSKLNTFVKTFDAEDTSDVRKAGTISGTNGVKNAGEPAAGAHKKAQSELKDFKRLNEAAEDPGPDGKRVKKLNSNDSIKTFAARRSDILPMAGAVPDFTDIKASAPAAVAAGDKDKGKMTVENSTIVTLSENWLSKEKITKASSEKLQKAPTKPLVDEVKITYGQLVEVTRRPDVDRSKWFTGLPWEDRLKNASEKGSLILLQNLDPGCTSSEVEDIIWHGCHESCSAKMMQRTAFSSPHCGQAFAIFKTREAAEKVIQKLDQGCLMLPHGRPLVGCVGAASFPTRQSSFPGHLLIDKAKFQMQKGKKDAVSTSHSSQPNTLEYEMAMEWRLHQARSDFWWKKLNKQQGEELRKLKANLKIK